MTETASTPRKIYCVLSARSLPYAKACLASLLRNACETLDLVLLTDGPNDAIQLEAALRPFALRSPHFLQIFDQGDADRRADAKLAPFPHVARFRLGHPCWRKITDPALYASDGDEVIVIDPDVYFPNRFTFEAMPQRGFLLMWQRPNCLLPEALVDQAYDAGIDVADHTDIGVCQYRAPFPFAALNHLLGILNFENHKRSMHVESVVWAALAMEFGGGYLDPDAWHCYGYTVVRRLTRRLGRSGVASLQALPFQQMKAFHAGGVAKNWLPDAEGAKLFNNPAERRELTVAREFVLYPRSKFTNKRRNRRMARKLGLYRVLGSDG